MRMRVAQVVDKVGQAKKEDTVTADDKAEEEEAEAEDEAEVRTCGFCCVI